MSERNYQYTNDRGNILFLILLAVVLFATLSYVVTSSLRGGGKDASSENWQTGASDILNQFIVLDTALTRMQIGGIKPENISFETTRKNYNGTFVSAYINSNCVNTSCKLFDNNGGALSDRNFEKYGQANIPGSPTIAQGYWDPLMMQWPQAGTLLNDVVIRYLYLNPNLCRALEVLVNIDSTALPGLTGTYNAASTVANWDNAGYTVSTNSNTIIDKSVFTQYVTSSGITYCHVYHLLFAR